MSSVFMFHFGRAGLGLSLPMQLSIRMVWCGVLTM